MVKVTTPQREAEQAGEHQHRTSKPEQQHRALDPGRVRCVLLGLGLPNAWPCLEQRRILAAREHEGVGQQVGLKPAEHRRPGRQPRAGAKAPSRSAKR